MIVTEIPVNLTLPPPKTPRTPGQHISGIIRCMAAEFGILKAEWVEELSLVDVREITDPTAILRIRIGLAWEEHYIPSIPDVEDHPGELCIDGIYATHDGESLSVIVTQNGKSWETVIHEVKATYKSIRTVGDLTGEFMWLAQIKAYCKGKGTRFAQLHALFLCGDYSFPIKPDIRIWQLEFTQEEIDGNWEALTQYLQYRKDKENEEA